jgi:L,D-peptidoglycan transpeptidase YkuD (ErfK/YbiS/YcfS/YnhG family)
MRTLILLLLGLLAQRQLPAQPLNSRQLVVVKTAGFDAVQGQLSVYERDSLTGQWQQKLALFAVTVGRKGLAWGAGVVAVPSSVGPRKREGDGRSPAGIFPIGMAFGSRSAAEVGPLRVPYIQTDRNTFCVDDSRHPAYNRLVHTDTLQATWTSAERMLIPDYEYGLVVEYNYTPARPNDGSCIFIHLWQNSQTGTAGCTAMNSENLLKLLRLLDVRKRPLLVQMPEQEYARWQQAFRLP